MAIETASRGRLALPNREHNSFVIGGTVMAVVSLLLVPAWPSAARTFYVSPNGDDKSPGTEEGRPWKTIAKVNRGEYGPGDSIKFQGGQTFQGSLLFTPRNHHGTVTAPVVLTSYGRGRATIASGKEIGLFAQNVGATHIVELNFVGAAANSGASGIAFVTETNHPLSNIEITGVEISQYTNAIYIAAGKSPAKFERIRIERAVTHDNAMGPGIYGYLENPAALNNYNYGIRQVYVGHIHSYDNKGAGLQGGFGGGLVLMNTDEVVIERNVIHDNGGNNPEKVPNGPSGIIVYDGRNVTVQNNEVYRQRFDPSVQTDASGIDLWALNAVIQYNYIHDNEGWGFVLGSANTKVVPKGTGWESGNVTLRYNIAENNGRPLSRPKTIKEYMGATVLMFGQLRNYEIYNNTFYSAGSVSAKAKNDDVQGMIYLVDVPGSGDVWSNIHIRNNLLMAMDDVTFVEIPRPSAGKNLRFENNAYVSGRNTRRIKWADKAYDSLGAWSKATGQEQSRSGTLWRVADPATVCAPGKGGTMAPKPLSELVAYRLRTGSPLIGGGLDLRRAFGLDVGTRDFFGNPIPSARGFDVGAHAFQPGQSCS